MRKDHHYNTPKGMTRAYGIEDTMKGYGRIETEVLDQGFVALVDVMPRMVPEGLTADSAIVQAARVSYQQGTKKKREDKALIRYLMRHQHTSPFEMIETKWHCRMPLFVARQIIRHRTASVNELSGRYSELPLDFFTPDMRSIRAQSTSNKQSSDGFVDDAAADFFINWLKSVEDNAKGYRSVVNSGVDRGLARIGLSLATYTEWYWKMDLKNLMHFINLRVHKGAQEETQEYARAMYDTMKIICPITMEAFKDYVLDAITLTGPELRAVNGGDTEGMSSTEVQELHKKLYLLGFKVEEASDKR